MIIKGTRLVVLDNSGASLVECIHLLGRHPNSFAKIGDNIVVSIKRTTGPKSKVSVGTVFRATIVSTKKSILRANGLIIRFKSNGAVLLNSNGAMIATRLKAKIPIELCQHPTFKNMSIGYR